MTNTEHIVPLAENYPELAGIIPDYVERRLGLDERRLNRLTAISCVRKDVSFRVEQGEGSSYDTKIVGHADNTALDGAVHSNAAQLSSYERTDTDYGLKQLTITINSTAIEEQAAQQGKKVRDPHTWTRPLNKAIGQTFTEIALGHAVERRSVLHFIQYLGAVGTTAGLVYHQAGISSIIVGGSISMAVASGLENTTVAQEEYDLPHTRRHYSILPFTLDRVLATTLLTALPIIRPMD